MAKKKATRTIGNSNRHIVIRPSLVTEGENAVQEIMKKYGDVPLSQLTDMGSVKLMNNTWDNRPRSNIVKWMMDKSGKNVEDLAESMGCTTTFVNNKLFRGTFSFDDLIIIAYICGFLITITENNPDEKERRTYQIDVKDYFRNYNTDILDSLFAYEEKRRNEKKAEYDELKAKLEKMKEEYGFED